MDGINGLDLNRFCLAPVVRKTIGHFGMDGSDAAIGMDMVMQNCNITKANNPFWFDPEFSPVNPVHNPDGSITTSCTHDGFDGWIVEHFLKIFQTFIISPSKCEILFSYRITQFYLVSPALYDR